MNRSPSGLMPQMIILVGAAGSGKTSWAKAFASASPAVKWEILSAESHYAAATDSQRAYSQYLSTIEDATRAGKHVILDGHFTTAALRQPVLAFARQARYLVKDAVVFTIEPEVAIKRYIASEQDRLLRGLPSFHFSESDIRQSIAELHVSPPRSSEGCTALYDAFSGGIRKPREDVLAMGSPAVKRHQKLLSPHDD